MIDIVIAARIDKLVDIATEIRHFLHTIPMLDHDQQAAYAIELAVHELCTNIIIHAYAGMDDGSIAINVRFHAHQHRLEINLYDWGAPFLPEQRPNLNLEHGQEGGYGLFIIEQIVDSLHYRRTATTNHWQLIKTLGASYAYAEPNHNPAYRDHDDHGSL